MKLKKLFAIVSAAAVLCVILAGCGSSGVTTDGSTSMEKVIGALGEAFEGDTGVAVSYNPTGSGSPDAIGYASLAAVKDNVKALKVGGVTPTEETVKDGSYIIQRPFVLVTKQGVTLSDNAQKFFDYVTSADASAVISAAGAVPVK